MAAALDPGPRVLHVQTDTGLSGGIAGYIATLVRSRAHAGFRSAVVVPGPVRDPKQIEQMYGPVLPVTLPPTYRARTMADYVGQLEAVVRHHRVDLIHAHALRAAAAAGFVARRTGVPLVYTNHGLRYTQKTSGWSSLAFRAMEWWACRSASRVVCIRPFDEARLRGSGLIGDSRLASVTTITTRVPAPAAAPGARSAPPLIVGIGSMIEVKRIDRFIDWIAALRATGLEFDAIWIGDGPMRALLQERAERAHARIDWAGQLPRDQVDSALSRASLLFLTSRFEVFPLAVLEAYGHGVPVVTGPFDGLSDFLEPDVTGIVVDADTPGSAASGVRALLLDRPRWERMSRAARDRFERDFRDPEQMAVQYAQVYRQALHGRRPPP